MKEKTRAVVISVTVPTVDRGLRETVFVRWKWPATNRRLVNIRLFELVEIDERRLRGTQRSAGPHGIVSKARDDLLLESVIAVKRS